MHTFIQILDYGDTSVLRILVTHKSYPGLKKFNPFLETKAPSKTGTLPLVYFKRNWVQYTTMSSLHGKKTEMHIELLLDSIPPQNVLLCDLMLKVSVNIIQGCKISSYSRNSYYFKIYLPSMRFLRK